MDFNSLPVTEVTSAGILVWLLQELKKLPWSDWLPDWAYRVISVVWAIVSTLIVGRLTLPQTVFPQHGKLEEVGIDVWFMASQYVIQEVIFRMTGKQTPPEPEEQPVHSGVYQSPNLPPHARGEVAPGSR